MKKILLLLALLFAFGANASSIPEGAIVKTANNPDVYIIKYNNGKQYKRLVLNPLVFKSYGHLKWSNLLTISDSEMNSYIASDLVRVDGVSVVYQLVPEGDIGGKYLLISTDGYDLDSVYTINNVDFDNYSNRGARGAKVTGTESSTGTQQATREEPDDSAEVAALQAELDRKQAVADALLVELERKQKVLAVFDKLKPIINDIDNSMSDLSNQTAVKVQDMEALKTNPWLSQSSRAGRMSIVIAQYNALADQYNALSAKRDCIVTIFYELQDYADYGNIVPATDRAYLASLGISI